MSAMNDDLRDELTRELRQMDPPGHLDGRTSNVWAADPEDISDALLPIVERRIAQARAVELRSAALDAIEARADAATSGPWSDEHESWAGEGAVLNGDGHPIAVCGIDSPETGYFQATNDRTFIAHARADVPALVTEVRRLREQRDAARAEVMAELLDARRRAEQAERRAGDAEKHLIDSAGFDMADLMRSLDECVDRAEQAESEVKRLAGARILAAVFGVPEEAPQPFALVGEDGMKPSALGVQWPGGTVTVKSTPPERLGNTTSQSLEDFFTQYGRSGVVWLSEDLGSLADMEDRAEQAEAVVARVRELVDRSDNRNGSPRPRGDRIPAVKILRALDGDGGTP